MVNSLDRKLLRDLRRLRGQVLTIALVVCAGIGSFVTLRSTWAALERQKHLYYETQRFADAFVHLRRAPLALAAELARLPGVEALEPRVVDNASLLLDSLAEPVSAQLVSLPDEASSQLNDIVLTSGRPPEAKDETVVLDAFAKAHGIRPGDTLQLVVAERLRPVRVVGTALSPEFVFALQPGALTADPERFGVLWFSLASLQEVLGLSEAFNDALVAVSAGTSLPPLLQQIDLRLEPYGGLGALPRARQLSNFTVEGEIAQLRGMASVMPLIFLSVAAFLLNIVLGRLVQLQRSQIATLKALGYSNGAIAWHYIKLATLVVVLGGASGIALGYWGGYQLTHYYHRYFHFPGIEFQLESYLVAVSFGVAFAAALLGALTTVGRVARMMPAQAMRPPAPATYRRSLLEHLGVYPLLGPSSRMVLREVERRPVRLLLSTVAIALGVAIVVTGNFWSDAVGYLVEVQFHRAMREDVLVSFNHPQPRRVTRELSRLSGVQRAEGLRSVPVRVSHQQRYRDVPLWGYPAGTELRQVLDRYGAARAIPEQGCALTRKLAEVLGVQRGDSVQIQLREGDRSHHWLRVNALIDEAFGLQIHMRDTTLHALLGQQPAVSTVLLQADAHAIPSLLGQLRDLPRVNRVSRRMEAMEKFETHGAAMIRVFTTVATLLAAVLAVGVVYNNARISLSSRSRDLGSLRVLGFSRSEVARILLGELSVDVALALPLGLVIGSWLSRLSIATADPEIYRIPVLISNRTYALAVIVTCTAAMLSATMIRRKLDRLDLVGVLKTRE